MNRIIRIMLVTILAVGGFVLLTAPVSAARVVSDVAYGPSSSQRLDIYPVPGPATTVVIVHGGGWSGGDKAAAAMVRTATSLQADGFAVFSINYRLVTNTRDGVPMQSDDVASAVAWVVQNGGQHGADVQDLKLLGSSAGGQLVSLTGQLINERYPRRVDGVVSLSGPQDFVDTGPVATAQAGTMSQYLGCRLSQCTFRQKADPSPIYNISASSPPFLIVNSSNELIPADQARRMHNALLDAGISSTLRIVQGSAHGMRLFGLEERTIVTFLRS